LNRLPGLVIELDALTGHRYSLGPSGIDIGDHQVLFDRIGAYTFNKQAFVPQALNHYVEILKPELCGNLVKPIVSSWQCGRGVWPNFLFQS